MTIAPAQRLTGQRALVTGGTRGIGAATARALATAEADVIVNARTAPGDRRSDSPAVDLWVH